MQSLLSLLALVAVVQSVAVPTEVPATTVGTTSVEDNHSPAPNTSALIGGDWDATCPADDKELCYDDEEDDEDDFSYLDEVISARSLVPRAATDAYIDCTGIEELCDYNCYAILCLNQPRVLTKVSQAQARTNRRKCGAKYQPFKGTSSQLRKRGLSRPSASYVSAEEYPFASTSQGGTGADIFPALVSQQNTQRDAIRNMYSTYGIGVNDQFNLKFNNANTPYCNALKKGDYSVCNKKSKDPGPGGYDSGLFAYVRDSLANQNLHFAFTGK